MKIFDITLQDGTRLGITADGLILVIDGEMVDDNNWYVRKVKRKGHMSHNWISFVKYVTHGVTDYLTRNGEPIVSIVNPQVSKSPIVNINMIVGRR